MSLFDRAKAAAAGVAGGVADTVSDAAAKIEIELHQKKEELLRQAEAFKEEKMQMLKEFEEEKKKLLIKGFMEKFNGIFEFIMGCFLMVLKELLDDPYMPRFVKRWVDTILDAVWPDVKTDVRDTVMAKISLHEPLAHGEPCCYGSPLAFFRYLLFPYDRNFWRQSRQFLWWVCQIISIVPVYSVAQIYYFIIFILIDKRDQFQLEQFITAFKSLQFISLGVLSAIIGSVQYYVCTSRVPQTCASDAPRVDIYTIIIFAAQVFFVWGAFFLVPCSVKKGGVYYQQQKRTQRDLATRAERQEGLANALRGEALHTASQTVHEEDEDADAAARWRLFKLLIYDLIIFLICLGLALWVTYNNQLDRDAEVDGYNDVGGNNPPNWKYLTTLYWIKAFYGLMSFPFLLLRIPLLSSLFSHARPTGYNCWGNTVPYLGEEEDGPVPWDPHRAYRDEELEAERQAARSRRPEE